MRLLICISLCWLFLALSTSCNKYIDQANQTSEISLKEGFFNFYLDSNVLFYKTNVVLTRDKERIYPKSFKITLPKGIKHYEFTGSTDFGIYYAKQQVIFLRIDLEKNIKTDTIYNPNVNELENFFESKLSLSDSKYDILKISRGEKRSNLMVKKGSATILLYNIDPRKMDLFYKMANSFHFVY